MEVSVGRIVHVRAEGKCQPAIVVTVWPEPYPSINAVVFRDGSNDERHDHVSGTLTRWATSIKEGDGIGEYHDPRECSG